MASTEKIHRAVQPFLQPDEHIVATFVGLTKSGWWASFGPLAMLLTGLKYRRVVITERRHLVIAQSFWSATKLLSLVGESPRRDLGVPSGVWWYCDRLPEPLFIATRFHKRINEANQTAP
jgi:hypothetical protein